MRAKEKFLFNFVGSKELDDVLKELRDLNVAAAQAAIRESLAEAARPIVRLAKAGAPRRTGRLRRAIAQQNRKIKGAQKVYIGPRTRGRFRVRYGHLIEFGHQIVVNGEVKGKVPAQAYLRPAWDAEGGEKALKRLASALGPRIIKHAEKIAKKHRVKRRR